MIGSLRPLGMERWWVLAFLAPNLAGLLLGTFGSIFATIGISFADWDLLTPATYAAISNYSGLPVDRLFMKPLVNTLAFSGLFVPLTVVLSLLVAMGLNRDLPGISLFRTAYFLPTVSSPTAVGLLWTWIYAEDHGALNAIITGLGGDPVSWLGPKVALYSIVAVNAHKPETHGRAV